MFILLSLKSYKVLEIIVFGRTALIFTKCVCNMDSDK